MTTLLTFGTFDCPHVGHAAFLRRCERFADQVVVGLRSDAMVEELKGRPPVFDYHARELLIDALGYETYESDEIARDLIEYLRPDVLAVGSDWCQADALERYGMTQSLLDLFGTAFVFVPYTPGISTTILRDRLGG